MAVTATHWFSQTTPYIFPEIFVICKHNNFNSQCSSDIYILCSHSSPQTCSVDLYPQGFWCDSIKKTVYIFSNAQSIYLLTNILIISNSKEMVPLGYELLHTINWSGASKIRSLSQSRWKWCCCRVFQLKYQWTFGSVQVREIVLPQSEISFNVQSLISLH